MLTLGFEKHRARAVTVICFNHNVAGLLFELIRCTIADLHYQTWTVSGCHNACTQGLPRPEVVIILLVLRVANRQRLINR